MGIFIDKICAKDFVFLCVFNWDCANFPHVSVFYCFKLIKLLPFCAARFFLPVTVLTLYETLVDTVYSSFESAILGDCGAATRFDFDEPNASGSRDFPEGSLLGSLLGSDDVSGSDVGSLLGSDDVSGSEVGSLLGSLLGSDVLLGSLEGSDDGSPAGSGSLEGSATAVPMSCNNGNFLHSAVNFLGLHPKPTHDVPFTTNIISISFSSFNILQWILKSGVSVFVV